MIFPPPAPQKKSDVQHLILRMYLTLITAIKTKVEVGSNSLSYIVVFAEIINVT